jgi:hypothetical protein
MALMWVLQQAMDGLLFANAEELANLAQETGAEVPRGALRYPSESGGWHWATWTWAGIWTSTDVARWC